ncbi:unnamed protein product [Merluccius merluccius]
MHRKAFSNEKEVMSNEREDFQLEAAEMARRRKAHLKEKREIEVKREEEQLNEELYDYFHREKQYKRPKMEAFKKDRSEHRMHRKAFTVEKDKISNEVTEMTILSLRDEEKNGIEGKREIFLNEANNLKALCMDLNLNNNQNSVYLQCRPGRKACAEERQHLESVWTCQDRNGNCTYGQETI